MAYNILVVDDSLSMRAIIKKVIAMSGFDVGEIAEAGNGLEALAKLEDFWADVVLSDIHMPEMDGIELLKKIKSDPLMASMPVVMITTESRDEVVSGALAMGAAGYIKKPFRPEDIKALLVEILGGEDDAVGEDQSESDDCDF
ncbi:MAG: response regulator [Deltaproteobacteria bacterium]|nr:response regulator [Candidatus Tharpella aukensis]